MPLTISVIIPTLNRKKDLEKTLKSISKCSKKPTEILIIDQSDNEETQNLCKDFPYLKIKYYKYHLRSSSLARNFWINNVDKKTDIIQFFDDDILLEKDYFSELEKFFIENKNAIGWVANITSPARKITLFKKIWLFLLTGSFIQDKEYVTSWWFNVMPFKNPNNLVNVEWTSWCWMFFRKSIFDEWFHFETNFVKYSLMEDCFLSYWIHKKYNNSLYFVPSIKLTHCESPASRIANKQRIYQNIIHRYYFIKKFNKSYFAYLRTMFIFFCFDFYQYRTFDILKYYRQWLMYIIKNKDKILEINFNDFIFWA